MLIGLQAKDLLADAREFLSAEEWYAERGVPWRRGVLLYGLPGTGKTSLTTAIAGELGLNIYSVALGSAGMNDEALVSLMLSVPKRALLLIEDVDAAFSGVVGEEGKAKSRLSLSGLMNALDGVLAQQGCLLVMTTNSPEKLPERLLRSGRIDVRCEFGLASKEQIRGMFRLYYGSGLALEDVFVDACPEGRFSCSDMQAVFTLHKHSPEAALTAMHKKMEETK